MPTIKIKPLSVNKAYRGRRFATKDLHDYKQILTLLLPKLKIPEGKLSVSYTFALSSSGGDGDNLIKCFQDCLADIYDFNDNRIYKWQVLKLVVPKGKEYIDFSIESLSTP